MLLKNSIANNWSRFAERCVVVSLRNFERANKTESHSTDFHETFGLSKRKRSEVYLHDRSTLQPASSRNFATGMGTRWLQRFRVPLSNESFRFSWYVGRKYFIPASRGNRWIWCVMTIGDHPVIRIFNNFIFLVSKLGKWDNNNTF